jgi:hypothetical protein
MDFLQQALAAPYDAYRGLRQHRYMESADINVAFRELFTPLRANIRRGLTNEGQLYGMELDDCIPGELLGTLWIPPVTRGVQDPVLLVDPVRRLAVYRQLLAEQRPEALFAYVCERSVRGGGQQLFVEVVSADARHVAEYPVCAGTGWHQRELQHAMHRRMGPLAAGRR